MLLSLNRPSRFPPRAPRRAIKCRAVAWLSDDRHVPILITNISAAGFTAIADIALPPVMTEFGVELPDLGIIRAQIRWIEDREFGSRFETLLNEAQIATF